MGKSPYNDDLVHRLAENDLRMLLDLCADYYWQEDHDYRCQFLHSSRSKKSATALLGKLVGATPWELGMLVTGKGQSWAEHLYIRKRHEPFFDLICQLTDPNSGHGQTYYLSISGQPRFDGENKFIGYHCVARDITHQVDNEHSLRRFRAAMDMSGDMIYLVDRATLKFIDVNETAWRNAGISRQQLLAADLSVALGEPMEEIERRYDRLILEGISSRVETRSVNQEGKPVVLETYSRASCIDGQWIIIGVTRNITRRKNSELSALRLQQMFSALSETNAAILRADSPTTLYQSVCEAAIKGGKFNMASVLIPDASGHMRAAASAGTIASVIKDIRISANETVSEGKGLAGTAFRTGQACISNDFLLDERTRAWHDIATLQSVASAAAYPLLTNKACTAVLLFYSSEKNPFDEEMIELLQGMADNVSFALDNFYHEDQRREAEEVLRESEARFRSLTQLSSDFYWEVDAQLRFTKYEGKIVGTSNANAVVQLIGNHIWNLDAVTPTSMSWDQFRHTLEKHERFRDFEISFRNDEESVYHFTMGGEPILDENGNFHGYRGITRDVTERKRISDHIKYLATHDSLTGLPNRVMFTELLEQATKLAARYNNRSFAILFIDLDRFKLINDTYGHHMGDELLKGVAVRLRQPLRASDVVARMGGDEFVILLQEVTDRKKISKVANSVLHAFAEPIIVNNKECRVTVSIGISIYGVDALDEETLMKHADAAMYVAKDEGKDNFQFYSRSIHLRTQEKIDLEVNLRNALKNNELTLHYQPKLNLRSGLVAGVEALLRWKNPQLGNISPDRFIPIAEENGMIIPIGEWVLRTACMQSMAWQKEGLFPFCIAVNLSARQFNDPELMNKIKAALHVSGMSAHQLEIEITESMVINHPKRAMKLLEDMKSLGLKIALDDFGTGYSSLGQLKHYPVDTLKIDRTFINEIPGDEDDKAITTAIISMAKTLGLTVVAEGVETPEQLQFLAQQSCHHIQGFHFQKPMPAADFAAWFNEHDPAEFLRNLK